MKLIKTLMKLNDFFYKNKRFDLDFWIYNYPKFRFVVVIS